MMSDTVICSTNREPSPMTMFDAETGQEDGNQKMPSEQTVKRSLLNFSEATTFHGYRFVFERNTHILRRLLWLVLVLAAMLFLCYLITNRVMHYYEYPMTTSAQIMSNGIIKFPAVTICNLNKFKISQVEKNVYIGIVDQFTPRQESRKRRSIIGTDFSIPMKEVIENTMHKKSDLIVECSWNSNVCSHVNFSKILTENGVCYTFNGKGTGNELITTDTGEGLRLVLNIETYEYMAGQNPGAGIKVITHEKHEYPSVVGGGHLVSSDTDTRLNLEYSEYEYLGKPYGSCEKTLLRYMNYSYSVAACHLECLSDYANRMCGCIAPYMPGPYIKCDAYRALCVANIRNSEFRNVACSCPPPCVEYRYTPTSSYSSLSEFTVDMMKKQLNVPKIQIDVARASHSRMLARDNLMYIHSGEWEEQISALGTLDARIWSLTIWVEKAKVLTRHLNESCYERVSYTLEKLSLLKHIRNKFREHLAECRDINGISSLLTLHQLIMAKQFHNVNERLIGIAQDNIISSLQERDNVLVKINNAYSKRVKHLLSEQPWINIRINLNNNVSNLLNSTEQIIKFIENIDTLDSEQEMELLDLMKLHSATSRDMCQNLLTTESVISTQVSDLKNEKLLMPVCFSFLTKVYHYYVNLNTAFNHLNFYLNKIKTAFDELSEMRLLFENVISHDFIREKERYLENVVYEQPFDDLISAIEYWTLIMAVAVEELPHEVDKVFFSINPHMSNDINELMKTLSPINFSEHGKVMVINSRHIKYIYKRWIKVLKTIMDKMKIDAKFYRKNFIHLHISYHVMTYRKIIQRPSYEIVALMSDIGGNMGLLIGGSVISLFEVIDIIFIITYIVLSGKNNKANRTPHIQDQRM